MDTQTAVDQSVDVSFESGDAVFVVSSAFEPVVQRGEVAKNSSEYRSIDVQFDTDPFDADDDNPRMLGCDESEMLHVDADAAEVLSFIGREDLIEPEDLE